MKSHSTDHPSGSAKGRVDQLDAAMRQSASLLFPGSLCARWFDTLESIPESASKPAMKQMFARAGIAVASRKGPEIALEALQTGLVVRASGGDRAVQGYFSALPAIMAMTKDRMSFRTWLRTIKETCGIAPQIAAVTIQQSPRILASLDVQDFRSWLLNGIRLCVGDQARMLAYVAHADTAFLRTFDRHRGDVAFADVAPAAGGLLLALWKIRPTLHTLGRLPGGATKERVSFDGLSIQVPEQFSGYRGPESVGHFGAAITHVGAHIVYTRQKFVVGSLRPIQRVLIGLIEDARVEALAAMEYPGLGRRWHQFQRVQDMGVHTAEGLMQRLTCALADPAYRDKDTWVSKGQEMFFDLRDRWEDQSISRTIGGLLGNDLGQMRIQFNAKTHVIEPSYRDDNAGIWQHTETPPGETQSSEDILEAGRVVRKDTDERPERRDEGQSSGTAAVKLTTLPSEAGLPIARRPEWDYLGGSMLRDWVTIKEFSLTGVSSAGVDEVLSRYEHVARRITSLVKSAKVSRPVRLRRQAQGDRLDLDACIRATIDRRGGMAPDFRIYEINEMRSRDLSVLLLLDASESTRDRVKDGTMSVMALQRAAAAMLGQALSELGDPFAIQGFCSNGRSEVRTYRIKEFSEAYTQQIRARLSSLRGMFSTRLGAALRQAGAELNHQATHRKLVLVVTDGEPADIDIEDPQYLVEDARNAVQQLSRLGIDVFCVGLNNGRLSYLPRIFGARNHLMISKIEMLPEKLPLLYLQLTV